MKSFLKKFFDTYVWLMILVFVIDIVTKWCVFNYFKQTIGIQGIIDGHGTFRQNTIAALPGFLHIGCALNQGAAWSIGTTDAYDGVNPVFIVISVVLSAALIFYYVKEFKKLKTPIKISLALMISGAVGNMIDRTFYRESITGFKGVIDWIYVAFMDFPTFNIADSALVIGIAILIIYYLIEEVKEAIDTLHNKGPKDFTELCLTCASIMLVQAKVFKDLAKAKAMALANLKNGKAYAKFKEWINAQGGDTNFLDNPNKFRRAEHTHVIKAKRSGYIKEIEALAIGEEAMHLGAGRLKTTDIIDPTAGIVLNKKVGDKVKVGDTLCVAYTNKHNVIGALRVIEHAFKISKQKTKAPKVIIDYIK